MKKDSTAYGAIRPTWDKNDCSIRALSVATGCSYEQASMMFSAFGRKLKKGTGVFMSEEIHERALYMERLDVKDWPLLVFAEVHNSGAFIVHKRSHAFAVIDGVIHDWESTTKVNTRIIRAWKVTEKTLAKVEALKKAFG